MFFVASAIAATAGERVLTTARSGHMLHHRQAFSPDGHYLYFDSRNDETKLSESTGIGRVEMSTGKEEIVFRTAAASPYGPGCGAVTCSPVTGQLAFIHGLVNASPEEPYAFSRRFCGSLSPEGKLVHLDARDITAPYTPGSLRGGTHAHHWSPDGSRISFTYNDSLIPEGSDQLRTVGIMQLGLPVGVEGADSGHEFAGTCFTVTVAQVTLHPKPGSDEISRAFDEGWIDKNHLAFQGNVLTEDGRTVTELFVATLPEDLTKLRMPEGAENYPQPPQGVSVRRITHTATDRDAGVTGPRHWVRPRPGGRSIAFLDTDQNGIVQIFSIPTAGGKPDIISNFEESVIGPFNWSPDGRLLACAAGGTIWLLDADSGKTQALTEPSDDAQQPCCSVVFSPDGKTIAFNRLLPHAEGADWLQICTVPVDENF